MSALENQIPTLPISSENVYYTDMQNNTKMLNIYLNHIDAFKEQMVLILQNINKDIKNLQESPISDSIALPISAADVNYTKPDESTVPLNIYLNNYNKPSFRQSIIDHTSINTPYNSLKETITTGQKFSTTIKTIFGGSVFPKTTHTLLTCYYTSYIETLPKTTDPIRKPLVKYFCTNEKYTAFEITVINSTVLTAQLAVRIYDSEDFLYKLYYVTQIEPKVVIDLTDDLAKCRYKQEVISAQFSVVEYGGSADDFYQHCVNILSNVFISYTYDN
jgi:hypothetical protein